MWLVAILAIQEQVQSSEELDLPAQHELHARFRCDKIYQAALDIFNNQVLKPKAGCVVEGLGSLMAGWKETTLGLS
jgi:hypothetical protein